MRDYKKVRLSKTGLLDLATRLTRVSYKMVYYCKKRAVVNVGLVKSIKLVFPLLTLINFCLQGVCSEVVVRRYSFNGVFFCTIKRTSIGIEYEIQQKSMQ